MRFMRMVLVLVGLPLAACQTAQQQAKNEAAADDAACRSYGLQFGTPAYAECRQRREVASQQQALAALGALQGINRPQPAPAPYMMQTPTRTTCSSVAGTTNCTTY